MRLNRLQRHRGFALLTAVLLLLSNALVTAHAFGEVDHAVKDGCQLLHQVERQPAVAAGALVPALDTRRFAPPENRTPVLLASEACHHYQTRAPPLA